MGAGVAEGGKAIRLSKREALAKSMVNNAIKGDQRALNNLLKQLPAPKADDTEEYAAVPLVRHVPDSRWRIGAKVQLEHFSECLDR